jgi:copper(I)-binding protein
LPILRFVSLISALRFPVLASQNTVIRMCSSRFWLLRTQLFASNRKKEHTMNLYRYCFILAGALALAACTATSPATPAAPANTGATGGATIQISDPWARAMKMEGGAMGGMEQPTMAPASGSGYGGMEPTKAPEQGMAHGGHGDMEMGGANSAAYMIIRNTGNEPDKLIAASSDVAKTIELHTVIEEGGVMRMRQVEGGIDIPANGQVELKPGGFHVMLIGLTRDLNAGDSVQLTLTFEKAGQIPVTAQVRQP